MSQKHSLIKLPYLDPLALMSDSATYHGSATARDRDKVRQAVLENLGWTILRIWSTDWFKNSKAVVERIHEALTEHLETDRAERAAIEQVRAEEQAALDAEVLEQAVPDSETVQAEQATEDSEGSSDGRPTESSFLDTESDNHRQSLVASATALNTLDQGSQTAASGLLMSDPDQFYEASYIPTLELLIAEIVEKEGPLPVSLLGRRISALHGWQRTGRRIADQVRSSLAQVEICSEGAVEFAWSRGSYSDRISFREGLDRGVRDISRAEIASLYDANAGTLNTSEDPVLELARIAGINRLSSDARSYLTQCLEWRNDAENC